MTSVAASGGDASAVIGSLSLAVALWQP